MPPAKKKTEVRQTFATKLPPEMITRLRGWAFAHDVEIQDLVELALDEFLTQRGAPRASSQEVS